jgi:cytidylate kinase
MVRPRPAKAHSATGLPLHFGLRHLDTGLIYRAVAKAVLDAGGHPGDVVAATAAAKSLDPSHFDEVALKAQQHQ